MNILIWIVFGAIAGWIASLVMKSDGSQGTIQDIVLGIVGSVVGGYIMEFTGNSGVTGFNLYSFGVAVLGAVVLLYIGRMVRKG